ncbi:MAG: hypothetical protein Q4C83_03385, partial [Candidatus Saccharibacteria bacterium]|nr:hypothetical protein [Candidatus Saccharibacteria bacterium]
MMYNTNTNNIKLNSLSLKSVVIATVLAMVCGVLLSSTVRAADGALSLSLTPNTNSDSNGNINLTIPTGGGVVNGSHTINYTISNIPTGLVSTTYNLTLSSNTANTDMTLLDPVTSTVKNKLPTITP